MKPTPDLHLPLLHPSQTPETPIIECRPSSKLRICGVFGKLETCINAATTFTNAFFKKVWHSIKEDPRRIIHSLKMAVALAVAFLLVLLEVPYEQLGSHAIWAILTVVVVFELTVGATLSKGLNRGLGTLIAGLLATGVGELARLSGGAFHPVVIGISVFITGGVTTYARLWPAMKSYEFGFRTFLITFCLIIVTSYRMGNPVVTAMHRFVVIAMGAAIGLAINLFVLPSWAGEELHGFIAKNFDSVADSLEVCVQEYLRGVTLERVPSKILMGQVAADDPVYKGYRSALVSASKEETLANSAVWEPPHGKFRTLKYPWRQYVKVGAVLRHCAYSVVALHGCLRSAIQAPSTVRKIFETEFREVSMEAAKVLRDLGKQVANMQKGRSGNILLNAQKAVARLQESLYLHSYLLVKSEAGLHQDARISISLIPSSMDHNGEIDRLVHVHTTDSAQALALDACTKNFFFTRLKSWPARDTDDTSPPKSHMIEQNVRVLESAGALSLGTFASLLMEAVARLEYVVSAVEELSELAKFKEVDVEDPTRCL